MVSHRQILLDALRDRIAEIRREAERTPLDSADRRAASRVIARIGLSLGKLMPVDTAEGQLARALCDLGARDVLTKVRGTGRHRYAPRSYRVSA